MRYVEEELQGRPQPISKPTIRGRQQLMQAQIHKCGKTGDEVPPVAHTIDTIAEGFAGGGETSLTRKCYVRQVMHVAELPINFVAANIPDLNFSPRDLEGISPHNDDPLAVVVQFLDFKSKATSL